MKRPTLRRPLSILVSGLLCVSCAQAPRAAGTGDAGTAPAESTGLTLAWEENMLDIRGADLPGGRVQVWYLEAFCRPGSTRREWAKTVIPHRTEKLEASADGKRLKLRSEVEGGVEVLHEIVAGLDEVDFRLTATNHGAERVDVDWAQPCVRVGEVTGRTQETYIDRSFIFVDGILTTLDRTDRTEDALYRGGQVYVPEGIGHDDVNPRPISLDEPSNGIIGCFSADGGRILAMAWEPYQELFQGVIVCLHSDFRIGGLEAGETKHVRGKIYWLENDPERLVERYEKDFAVEARGSRSP
jgi:hypothetical protein